MARSRSDARFVRLRGRAQTFGRGRGSGVESIPCCSLRYRSWSCIINHSITVIVLRLFNAEPVGIWTVRRYSRID